MRNLFFIIFNCLLGFSLIRVVTAPDDVGISFSTFITALSEIDYNFEYFFGSLMRLLDNFRNLFLSIPDCTSCNPGDIASSVWGIIYAPIDVVVSLVRDIADLLYDVFSCFHVLIY